MATVPMPASQEAALRDRPHLAFVIECLGLASLVDRASPKELRTRLEHCLQQLSVIYPHNSPAEGTPQAALTRWLEAALREFTSLSEQDFPVLLQACASNTMPDWLKVKVRIELGEAISALITGCLDC